MLTRDLIGNVCRTVLGTVLIFCAWRAESSRAQQQEELPEATLEERSCALEDRPLMALTVDINPLDPEGQFVTHDNLPEGCFLAKANEAIPFFISYGSGCWDCHDILQLARFCHPRLFFEDVMLERYGVEPVFPCLYSSSQFTCDLFLLPARLLVNKRHPCVRTPTPHCWSGSEVCSF